MDKEKRKLIIKALQKGVSLRRISRELNIPIATLSTWCNGRDKEMEIAYNGYKAFVDNIFSS